MTDGEVCDKDATLPRARLRASWWRRFRAWLSPTEAVARCHRCDMPLERDHRDADNHEKICAWFAELKVEQSKGLTVVEAAQAIEEFNARLRQSLSRRLVWPRLPVPTLLPGPGEGDGDPVRMPIAGPGARQSR